MKNDPDEKPLLFLKLLSIEHVSSHFHVMNTSPRTTSLWRPLLCDYWVSSVPWPTGLCGGQDGRFSSDPLPVFSAGGPCEQFGHRQGCPLFDVVHPAFPLLTTALPTLQGALIDGFGEAVTACDMPKPCTFPSLDSCQKRFLWTHRVVDLSLHPVIGPVLQVGDVEKFPHALCFESMHPPFRAS